MSRILYVSSSPRGSTSYSNQVAAHVIRELQQTNPQATVTVRDLAQDPLPHVDVATSLRRPEAQMARARSGSAPSLHNRMLWLLSCSPLTSSSSPRQ